MDMRTVFLLISAVLTAAVSSLYAAPPPDWFLPLREAIYEQNLKADAIVPLYEETENRAKAVLSGADLYVTLSRCEYMMGRAYQDEQRKAEAADRYDQGMKWAEQAINVLPSAEAWQMLAENLSQACAVRSTSYVMKNGLNVEKYAKNALAINGRNAAAQYMIAARWVFAPAPFNNIRKGLDMMQAILAEADPEKDDLFNVYFAIGYAYIQQKKHAQARPWLLKSLEVYPSNKYALSLLEKT
jgi:tetratricopeptide (TPR) repeat protein